MRKLINGKMYTTCDVCDSMMQRGYMYNLIITSLGHTSKERIPDLCGERCGQKWMSIRGIPDWKRWCAANDIKVLI